MEEKSHLESDLDLTKLKVPELRRLLADRNIPTPRSAKKQQLVDMLMRHNAPHKESEDESSSTEEAESAEPTVEPEAPAEIEKPARPVRSTARRGRPRKSAALSRTESNVSEKASIIVNAPAEAATPRPRRRNKPVVAINALGSDAGEPEATVSATPTKTPRGRGRGRGRGMAIRERRTITVTQSESPFSDDDTEQSTDIAKTRSRTRAAGKASESVQTEPNEETKTEEAATSATAEQVQMMAEAEPTTKQTLAPSTPVSKTPAPARTLRRRVGRIRKSTPAVSPLSVDAVMSDEDFGLTKESVIAKNRIIADTTARAIGAQSSSGSGTPALEVCSVS
jgi:hypothetical protein